MVFVDNMYDQVKKMMSHLSGYLFAKGLTTTMAFHGTKTIRPNFSLPEFMRQHLFTDEDGLIPKYNVKFHHMALEIAR